VRMVGESLLWAAALLTIVTGYDYLRAGLHHMNDADERPRQGLRPMKAAKPSRVL
jgi:cardiolipin synthase (CMP-forming)